MQYSILQALKRLGCIFDQATTVPFLETNYEQSQALEPHKVCDKFSPIALLSVDDYYVDLLEVAFSSTKNVKMMIALTLSV